MNFLIAATATYTIAQLAALAFIILAGPAVVGLVVARGGKL